MRASIPRLSRIAAACLLGVAADAGPAVIVRVGTVQQVASEILRGTQHMELVEHVDLSNLYTEIGLQAHEHDVPIGAVHAPAVRTFTVRSVPAAPLCARVQS